ncbi:Ig-like domain-containing protein, partial [Glaesserella parasuis]|nr:Ig-like domain-containing protein [Glaesserella parasuis]
MKDVPVTPAAGEGTAQPTTPTAVIEKDKLTNGDQVSTVAVSPSGNESTPSEPVTVTKDKETSAAPTEVKITAIDSSSPADATPERFIVQGKGKPGATIEIKDPTGKVVATPVVGTDGTFKADFTLEKGLEAGQKFDITATEPGKGTSAKVDDTAATIPAVKAGKFDPEAFAKGQETGGHTSTIAPEAPAVETKDNGKLGIDLPTNPAPGTEVTAKVDTNGDGQPDSTTTYTAQPNGDWKVTTSENKDGNGQKETTESTLPKGTESAEISAPEGSKVTVSEKDPAGNESKPTEIVAPKAPEQTEAPVVDSVKSVDTNGDGKPDNITVEVTAKPGETVKVKDPKTGNVIGEAVADENGKATVVATPESTDLTAEDKLPVTATAPGKTESEAGKTKPAEGSPEGTQGSESTVGNVTNNTPVDNTPPAPTEIAPKENGDYGLEIPEDATKATVKVGDQETTLTRNEDGKLVSNNPELVKVDENGNVSIPAGVVEPSKPISVTTEDKAGNKTTDTEQNPEKITPATETTATPVLTKITAIDQSNPADDKPELVKVEGTIEEADGTVVTVTIGNQAFTAVVKDKKFEVAITDRNGFDVSANDTFKVTAKAEGKLTSPESKGVDNAETPTVPAVGNTAADHTGDTTAPSAPQLSTVPGTGAVAIDLPTDAKPGDTVEVTFKKPDGSDGKVTLTRQPNGGWKSDDEALIQSVEKSDKPQAILGEDKVKDGEPVNAKSKDGFIAGKENATTPVNAGSDAKSATPTDITVKAVDTSAAADNNPEKVVVSGKAAPNADITIKKGDVVVATGKAKEDGTFSIDVPETYAQLEVGDQLTIQAKDGNKRISEATSPVAITAPAEGSEGHTGDTKAPLQATVARNSEEKGDGQVKVTVPTSTTENPLVAGDKVLVKFTPEQPENSPETTVELVYQGEGGKDGVLWKSSDESKVPSVRVGETTTTLAEDTVKDKTPVTVQTVDLAGQKATESKLESAPVDETLQAKDITVAVKDKNPQASTDPDEATITGKVEGAPQGTTVTVKAKDGTVLGTTTVGENGTFSLTLTEDSSVNTPDGKGKVPANYLTKDLKVNVVTSAEGKELSDPVEATIPAVDLYKQDAHTGDNKNPEAPKVTTATNDPSASDNEGYVKIEFPATTGANPIVEGDKVTINYTPENTDGTAGTPTTLTYTYTGGKWVQDEKDSLKLEPTTDQSGKVSVTIPEDKVADKTSVSATTTDVAGHTSAESESSKKDAPFDVKSDKPVITSIKAIDTSTTADKEPERVIIEGTSTEADGTKVYLYKEGQTNGQPIATATVANRKFTFDITEPTTTLAINDKFVVKVQAFAGDKATEEVSQPSDAFAVPEVKVGKHNDADVTNSGGHKGDETAPTTAPTLTAVTTDEGLGSVKVGLPTDAVEGDRVIVTFTPETPENAQQVSVTLTKGANGWTSDKPELIANPVNGNEVTIEKGKVKDNTEVTAVIKDLADNEKAASPNARAYPNERTKLESNVTLEKAIDTDAISNATPEKFTIKGTAEKDATVTATITLQSGEKVVIGTFKVTQDNGEFTFDTNSIREGDLKEKLKDFTFNTNGSATPITVEATKEGKAPSKEATVTAKAAEKGQAEQHTEKDAPENPTITPYMEGFGGAKVELPTPAEGETLEVEITVTPKVAGTDNNATPTNGEAKKVTLTNNGGNWSVVGNTNSDLVTIKEINGKKVAIISGDKAPLGGTISATTTDFAGNKQTQEATATLAKGPTDATANEPEYSKARTDVPTITAGRTEGTGTNSDQPNAGDIVAKPGGDNDRMVVKYKDEDGNAKEIAVKKDLEQGKWVVDDTATPSNGAQKAERSDYILQDDGTVIVKGPQVQDGSEAEAIGYKTVNGQEKASTEPYTAGQKSDGTWYAQNEVPTNGDTNQPLTKVERAVISAHKDDATPTQTDKPTVSKGDVNTLEKGSAKIKPGDDNTEVVVNFKGYARTVTETPNSATGTGQTQPTERKIITTQSTQADSNADLIYAGAQNTFATEEVDAVLVARKENGEWKLYSATKEDYEHKETGTDGQQHPSPRNLSPVSDDVATIDKDGNIVLKAAAVKDSTQVSATGFNAMKSPAEGAKDDNNITVDGDLTAEEVKNKTVDVPTIQQLNDGSVVAKPGQDNNTMTVTYDKKDGGQETITVEKVKVTDNGAPEGATKWQVKGNNGSTSLPEGVQLDSTTGAITIPKDKVNVDGKVNAKGKDEQNNEAKAEELTVKADATPESAEAAKVTTEGDKVVSEPGGDSKTQTVNAVDPNGEKTPIVVAEKGEDGKWKLDESDPNKGNANGATVQDNGNTITITKDGNTITLDKDTGKITIDPGVVSDGKSISTETADASGNTTSSGEPIVPPKKETSTDSAEKPIITPLDNGENKGGVQIKPGSDNTTFTVRYVKEPAEGEAGATGTTDAANKPQDSTLTAVKDPQTQQWSLSKDSQGKDIPSDVAEIDPTSGTITLKAKAVMDGSTVKATGTDILNNSAEAEPKQAPNNPDVVAPEAQPQPPTVVEAPPAPPASPEKPNETATPTNELDTPTLFQNTGTGTVKVTPGNNVDFISFTAAIGGQTQNFAFIKDAQGQWEKYVMKVNGGDIDNNGVLSGTETIEYVPVETANSPFTISNITSDKLTNITVGRAGDEYLTVTPDQTVPDNMDIGGTGAHTVHEFEVKTDASSAVPEKMHVLSNGEELKAPVIQLEKIEGSNPTKYHLKVTADPTKIKEIGFTFNTHGFDADHVIKSQDGKWVASDNSLRNDNRPYVVPSTDKNPNVFYIEDTNLNDSNTLAINNDFNGSMYGSPNNKVTYIVYTTIPDSTKGRMDEMYTGEEGTPWTGSGITLTDLTFNAASVPTGPAAANATGGSGTSSTGGSSGTQTGTGTSQPQQPPAPKVEELDEPKATVDNSAQGGVIVKPREGSSGEPKTKAFQVDYQQPDGTNRTIRFKHENGAWKVDEAGTRPTENHITVSTNGSGPIKLDTTTGQVTFAPSAVKDKTNVTITALDSNGVARKNATAQAAQEPQPVKPTAEIDNVNRGGAIVTPKENTNKFKLTYYDERNQKKELTYEKETNGQWTLKSGNAPNGVTLSANDGKVTLSPDAVRDRSQVKIESYNNEDRITQSATVITTTDKVEYTNVVGNDNGTPTGRVGYAEGTGVFGIPWHNQIDVYQDWSNNSSWGLQQVQEGKYGNSKPTSVSKNGQGATYT